MKERERERRGGAKDSKRKGKGYSLTGETGRNLLGVHILDADQVDDLEQQLIRFDINPVSRDSFPFFLCFMTSGSDSRSRCDVM